jgi:hypothetical protein
MAQTENGAYLLANSAMGVGAYLLANSAAGGFAPTTLLYPLHHGPLVKK